MNHDHQTLVLSLYIIILRQQYYHSTTHPVILSHGLKWLAPLFYDQDRHKTASEPLGILSSPDSPPQSLLPLTE